MAPNNRFFLTLLQYYSRNNNAKQGFVLPTLIGLGLIMTVVGLTMIGRSSNDQQTAISQKQSAQAQFAAEAGITRTLSYFNKPENSIYLGYPYPVKEDDSDSSSNPPNPWSPHYNREAIKKCGGALSGEMLDPSKLTTQELDNGYEYELISYTPSPSGSPSTGTIVMQGRKIGSNGNVPTSQIQVQFNINQQVNSNGTGRTYPVPSQYSEDKLNIDNNDFLGESATLMCRDCAKDKVINSNYCEDDENSENKGYLTEEGLQNLFNKKNNGTVEGRGFIGDLNLKTVPAPSKAKSINDLSDVNGFAERNESDDNYIDGAYHYEVDSIKVTGDSDIIIETERETIDEDGNKTIINKPVYIYVSGDLDFKGKARFGHSGNFGDLRIYGVVDEDSSQNITLSGTPDVGTEEDKNKSKGQGKKQNKDEDNDDSSGNSEFSGIFVHAPNATIGINGNGNFQGIMWGKKWDASASNVATFQAPTESEISNSGLIEDFNVGINNPSSPTSWKSESATSSK